MSRWSYTSKPDEQLINAANIFGVDSAEIQVTNGPQHTGWVAVLDSAGPGGVGTRKRYETLVALKGTPTEDNTDDTEFPDTVITIGTQPSSASANLLANANATASFTVVATSSPTANLTYVWEVSTNGGNTYSTATNGAVYSGATTATLLVDAPTGLNGAKVRAVVSAANTGATVTTTAATLTVAE